MSDIVTENRRALDEVHAAPCKGSLTRSDQCEMDGRRVARCWRHHYEFEISARLADFRLRHEATP